MPVCPHVQRLSTEPCIWMPLSLFYSIAFFLKNKKLQKICEVSHQERRKKKNISAPCSIWNSVPISFPPRKVRRCFRLTWRKGQGPGVKQDGKATKGKHSTHMCLGNPGYITSNGELLDSPSELFTLLFLPRDVTIVCNVCNRNCTHINICY